MCNGTIFGGIEKMPFSVCNFLKILMVSDKTIYKVCRIHKSLSTKPIREVFDVHCLPKLYIGFNSEV